MILTGIAGNICVLFTANDAYMRDLKIFAPADCIVSNTAAENDHALRQIKTVLKGNITESSRLMFRRGHGVAREPDAGADEVDRAARAPTSTPSSADICAIWRSPSRRSRRCSATSGPPRRSSRSTCR